MKKDIEKITALILLLFTFSVTGAFSQTRITLDGEAGNLHIYTLENGLKVFARKDATSALIRIQLSVKAGFSKQDSNTAGFLPLYSKIIFKKVKASETDYIPEINSLCNADSASFTASVSSHQFAETIAYMAEHLSNPFLSDEDLVLEYSQMKNDVLSYSKSTTGFINSSIDYRIFSEAPWQQDSGIYPSLFINHNTGELRTLLLELGKKFYTPQNSALFISGNISEEEVYNLTRKYFSAWKPFYSSSENQKITDNKKSLQKKFVLTDNSFSPELTQIIVQYTALSEAQCNLLASGFTGITSPLKKYIAENKILGIRSSAYSTAAAISTKEKSRLVIQALMEEPYAFETDPAKKGTAAIAQQADAFVETIRKAGNIPENELDFYKKQLESQYLLETGNSSSFMKLLADYWTIDEENFSEEEKNFYVRFKERMLSGNNETSVSIQNAINGEEPFVFLLVNSKRYDEQKNFFDEGGWEQITQKNSSWYKDELFRNLTAEEKKQQQPETKQQLHSDAETFLSENKKLFSEAALRNSIPVTFRKTPGAHETLISIAIKGGEAASPEDEHFLRTVLINSFAQNIQAYLTQLRVKNLLSGNAAIKAWTEDAVSYITLQCFNIDTQKCLQAVSDALLFTDVTPINADNLVYNQKLQWQQKCSSLEYQMRCDALSSIFGGTEWEKLYAWRDSILQHTTYSSFSRDYLTLLDASLYSIVVTGSFNETEFLSAAQNTMGLLMPQPGQRNHSSPETSLAHTSKSVRLRHTFTTNVKAEDAGEMPAILIPTTDFSDPVQYYFEAPESKKDIPVFNALLYELADTIQKNLSSGIKCSFFEADDFIPYGALCTPAIGLTNEFLFAYQNALHTLMENLCDKNECNAASDKIKSGWIHRNLGATATNEGTAKLIQKSILSGNKFQYLEDYCTVEKTDAADYLSVLEYYFPEEPVFQIFSADAKQ